MSFLAALPMATSKTTPQRFSRLSETATFRHGGLERWLRARIAVIGAGTLGCPLATAVVRSGGAVGVFDFDVGEIENQGTQPVEVGVKKIDSLVRHCDEIAADRAVGFDCDVRNAGVGLLDQFDLLIDCTDDPILAMPLTEISNGLGKPLLRCAVDGSGEMELGRILCSSPATGHACQICSYDLADLQGARSRTGCPNLAPVAPAATVAGGATAMAIAGVALLSAQRIITGNNAHLVLGRETIVDLSNLQIFSNELPRSEVCLTGHLRWELVRLGIRADEATFSDLFTVAAERLGDTAITLEPYLCPLNIEAACDCGTTVDQCGTNCASPPRCMSCLQPMRWRRETQITQISISNAASLGILDIPLTDLGLSKHGPLLAARAEGQPPVRFLLHCKPIFNSPSTAILPREVSRS